MMNAKHTPGPWEASERNGRGMGWKAGPAWLGADTRSEQTAADARLIAAAPDMLEALNSDVPIKPPEPQPQEIKGSYGSAA